MKYRGIVVPDWGKVNINTVEGKRQLRGALNRFLRLPESVPYKLAAQAFAATGDIEAAAAKVQAFATAGDFPTSVLEVLRTYQQVGYFDTGYEQIFDMIDMTASRRNGFELLDVESGLTFSLVPEGQKAKIYKMSGAKVTVTLDMYGAGLGWSKRMFDDEEYWNLERNAIAFRNAAYKSKAEDFYALIEAVAATYNLTWQNPVPATLANTADTYTANRDAQTINTACQNILIRTKDLGFGVTPDTGFILLAPIQLRGRIARAMGLVQQAFAGSVGFTFFNVRPIYTLMLADTTKYYVILPKNKIIGANRQPLTILNDLDVESYTEVAVGWQRYGGAIGEIKQIVRCATS